MTGISACNRCGAQYPSAPPGFIHKCGKCSGGYCSTITGEAKPVDREALREAVERFLADYDDGDRADVGCSALAEMHITDFRAALLAATPSAPVEDLPTMYEAFRTTTSGDGSYVMTFKFPTMEAMHQADDEWQTFRSKADA